MAYVRSIVVILASLALVPAAAHARKGPPSSASDRIVVGLPGPPRVIVAVLPRSTTVEQIGRVPGISPGVVSAGIGVVPSSQTYLDITQGNRVRENFYDRELAPVTVERGRVIPEFWDRVVSRAEDAPADIVPGLLGSTLERAGVPAAAQPKIGPPAAVAADEEGRVRAIGRGRCPDRACDAGLIVIGAEVSELGEIAEGLRDHDLLIALAAAPPPDLHLLAAGAAGSGFEGNLTSDSTRTDGVVLSTDIAPTILDRLGVDVPDEMNGTEIRAEGEPDAEEVADLQQRLNDRPERDLVLLLPLTAWLALTALAVLTLRGRGARVALPLLALACAWAPLMLLVGAALRPGEVTEALLVGVGAVALAIATSRFVPGVRGLALACGLTVVAHGVDVIAGSPLTSLSVLGPNPASGVRFFGIGNELEAALTTLTLVGVGAWLASRPSVSPRAAAAWFLGAAVVATVAFAPGRFGADVGAAIVLTFGGGAAAALALDLDRRRTALVLVGLPLIGLAGLVLVDLVLGGAHLSRTVLDAGSGGDVLDAFDRRLTLTVRSFTSPVYPELLAITAVAAAAGLIFRKRIAGWFGERWPARCGYLGAVAGIAIGTLANDSGAILLVIGTILLAAFAGFFWAVCGRGAVTTKPGS